MLRRYTFLQSCGSHKFLSSLLLLQKPASWQRRFLLFRGMVVGGGVPPLPPCFPLESPGVSAAPVFTFWETMESAEVCPRYPSAFRSKAPALWQRRFFGNSRMSEQVNLRMGWQGCRVASLTFYVFTQYEYQQHFFSASIQHHLPNLRRNHIAVGGGHAIGGD